MSERMIDVALGMAGAANRTCQQIARQTVPFVYNADIGLRKWRAALADVMQSTNKIINLNIINNSIAEGFGAGSREKGWANLLKSAFSSIVGDVGFGAIPYYQYSYYPTLETTLSGTWSTSTVYGFSSTCKFSSNPNASFSLTFAGTGIDILCYRSSLTGAISVVVDGGAAQQYPTSNATEVIAGAVSITGLSDAEHTITVSKVDDAKSFFFYGCCPTKGANGVRINTVGRNGSTINYSASANAIKAGIDYWAPALTVIEMFANEVSTNMTIANYKTYAQTIITSAKAYGDVLLLPTGIREDTYTYPQQLYIDALYELAELNSVCLIDPFAYWGSTHANADKLGVLADEVHPNAIGHQDIKNLVWKTLQP